MFVVFRSKIDICGRDFAQSVLLYFHYYGRSHHCIYIASARSSRNSVFFIYRDGSIAFVLGNLMFGAVLGYRQELLFDAHKVGGRKDELKDQEVKAWRFPYPASAISDLSR